MDDIGGRGITGEKPPGAGAGHRVWRQTAAVAARKAQEQKGRTKGAKIWQGQK